MNHYIINDKKLINEVKAEINAYMNKDLMLLCAKCGELANITVEKTGFCLDCLDEHCGYCNKDDEYYLNKNIGLCSHNEETYNVDYLVETSLGNKVLESDLLDYEALQDPDNWPENDGE